MKIKHHGFGISGLLQIKNFLFTFLDFLFTHISFKFFFFASLEKKLTLTFVSLKLWRFN